MSTAFAADLATFLLALERIDTAGGPLSGPQNFFRGGPLAVYDNETRQSVAALRDAIDTDGAMAVWEHALSTSWQGRPVWVHGDIASGNLLSWKVVSSAPSLISGHAEWVTPLVISRSPGPC